MMTMGHGEVVAYGEVTEDGVHHNVTTAETRDGVTTVTEGCTVTVTTDEYGYRSIEVEKPDVPHVSRPQ